MTFLDQIVPSVIPDNRSSSSKPITTREAFLADVEDGMKAAPMSVRLTPHIVSVANWASPFDDPVIRQFVPLKSKLLPDHPRLTMDSLHEEGDSPVPGLVHRYPDKVLFLGQRFPGCTRVRSIFPANPCRSDLSLSGVLSLLYKVVRRRSSHRHCQEVFDQADAPEVEQDV